jgi:chitodextrinase
MKRRENMLRNKIMPSLILFGLLLLTQSAAQAQAPTAPGNLQLYQATFTKAIFSWLPSTDDVGVTGYRIYRNGNEIGTSANLEYADTGLSPYTVYVYTVKAFDASGYLSLPSPSLTVRTLKNLEFENAAAVQQAVDSIDPLGLSAADLISAVQNALSVAGYSNIAFTQIDVPILSGFIDRELTVINEPRTPCTDAERITDQQELDQIMLTNFPGYSFAELYIQSKLVELGEEHWQKGHPDAAETLYEYSLNFMSDHEISVFNTLNRLAMFKHSMFATYATRLELLTSLNGYKSQLIRYFGFFPGSTSTFAERVYYSIAGRFFWNFPDLLYYDNYDQSIYDSAFNAIQSAKTLQNIKKNQTKLAKISAWELKSVKVSFKTSDGIPMSGMVDIVNTNGADVYPKTPAPSDNRRFNLVNGEVTIPVYKGHAYDMSASVNVQGGPAIKYSILNVKHENGFLVTCDHGQTPVVGNLANSSANGEILFISGQPTSPYNLSAVKAVDTFTLKWDWINPSQNYTLKNFKVFRGGIEIGTVTAQTMANIPLESTNNTYTYTVRAYDINDIPSDESLPLLFLPNFTSGQSAYFAWKQTCFGNSPMYDYEDPDNDGFTNYQEYLLGSNPTIAPNANVKSTLQNVIPGLLAKYYQGTWTKLPAFSTLTPLSSATVASPTFASTTGNILTSGLADSMGAVFTGYVDVPAEGFYRFYLTSDEGSRLYIDNVLLTDNDNVHTVREYSNDIRMNAGDHSIKLEYFEGTGPAVLKLEWAGPGFARRILDSQNLWYTTDTSALLNETVIWNQDTDRDGLSNVQEVVAGTNYTKADTDGDGLTDYEEVMVYNTNPCLADTDGDGRNDYEEVKVTFTDPMSSDASGTCSDVLVINGSAGNPVMGNWQTSGTAIYAISRNGTVEYSLNVSASGVYRLELEATRHNNLTGQVSFLLDLIVDGSSCGAQTLTASYGVNGKVWFYLPKLQTGAHSAKIKWTNVTSNIFLRINKLRLQSIGGPDTDSNGIPDWIDSRNEKLALVTVPATSKISPLCIEGENASNIEQISVSGFYTAPEEEPVTPAICNSIENGWYSDVSLSPDAPTNLTVSFQNNALSVNKTATWTPTNILTDGNATIRLNDSLLLTAIPEGAADGNVSITVEGQTYETTSDIPIAHKFENTGSFTVPVTYSPGGGGDPVTGQIVVKVVSSSFSGNPVCYLNEYRTWDNPQIADEAVIKSDRAMNLFESDLNPGRRLELKLTQNQPSRAIARLGEDGPIMANAKASVLSVDAVHSYLTVVDSYPDGSVMVQNQISLTEVPDNLRIYLRIFVAGVTFDDGTIVRWVTAADFDEYGIYKYNMIRAPGAYTGTCHNIMLYQGDTLLKTY